MTPPAAAVFSLLILGSSETAAIVGGMAAIVAIVLFAWRARVVARRNAAVRQQLADELGLEYAPGSDNSICDELAHLELFTRGQLRSASHVIRGRTAEADLALFDYSYNLRAANDAGSSMTVAYVKSPALDLPAFTLAWGPATIAAMERMTGWSAIAVPSHPQFSAEYYLGSADEAAIRALFGPELVELLERSGRYAINGQGHELVICRDASKPLPANQLRTLAEESLEITRLLSRNAAAE